MNRSCLGALVFSVLGALACQQRPSSVVIAPASASVATYGSLHFDAVVVGARDQRVRWSVEELTGGSVSADGDYLAPGSEGLFHVRATSELDAQVWGRAEVEVVPRTTISVSVSPSSPRLEVLSSLRFTATVHGTDNQAVQWSVEEPSGGTVDWAGWYLAPASPGSFHVVAVSVADPQRRARVEVQVVDSPVVVAVNPSAVDVDPGREQDFVATVQGTPDGGVAWSVLEGSTGGTISPTGRYRAPAVAGVYHVKAQSVVSPSKSATATVTVPQLSVALAPSSVTLAAGASQQFSATVTHGLTSELSWTVQEANGGTVDASGLYQAPARGGTYHLTARSTVDPMQAATATVVVTPVQVEVRPARVLLFTGQSRQFTATVTGAASASVHWSASGGTISASGLYTAPSTMTGAAQQRFYVTARSTVDTSALSTAWVDVTRAVSLSGAVGYAGAKSGRIYVESSSPTSRGTSLAAPGAFSLGQIPDPGTTGDASGFAFMDVNGNGRFEYALEPSAQGTSFRQSGTGNHLLNLTLVDPPLATPPAPNTPVGFGTDQGAMLFWSSVSTAAYQPAADRYRLYWSTTPNPGPTNQQGSLTVDARAPGVMSQKAFVSGLTNGTTYHFAVAALQAGVEGPVGAASSVVAGAATMGTVVSGTVAFPGLTGAGALYVWVEPSVTFSGLSPPSVRRYAASTTPVAFSVFSSTLRSGASVHAFLDVDGDGELDPTEPLRSVVLDSMGSPTNVSLSLPTQNADARVTTHGFDSPVEGSYAVAVTVLPGKKLPVTVLVQAGPDLPFPVPMGRVGGEARWDFFHELGPVRPQLGSYRVDVEYADGSQEQLSLPVTAVLGPVSIVGPKGTAAGGSTPTFQWTLPAGLPARYAQSLSFLSLGPGSGIWDFYGLAPGVTSLAYNADGRAYPAQLAFTTSTYRWTVDVVDEQGNSSSASAQFSWP